MMVPSLTVALLLAFAAVAESKDGPIVGVLAQELSPRNAYGNYTSYITANYVEAVQASGARVVPVFVGKDPSYYKVAVSYLNGLVIPGGAANYSRPDGIAAAAELLIGFAKKANDGGGVFPVLGVCQGIEILSYLWAGGNNSVLSDCSAENLSLPLEFREGFRDSSLFGSASDEDISVLSKLNVTSNHHRKCLTEKAMAEFSLDRDWKVLTTNRDRDGLEFVSTIENRRYPFVGIQFHPEKNAYEWSTRQVNPHSGKAVKSARLFYDWLVDLARTSPSQFPSRAEEDDAVIYNYNPVFTGKMGRYDTQTYFFE